MLITILLAATLVKLAESNFPLESKIVNGENVPITNFAHSAFLMVAEPRGVFVCGASIVNQYVLLTAAHCIDTCGKRCPDASVYTGNANKRSGFKMDVLATMVHEDYRSNKMNNDIGLILLKNQLSLNKYVKRVALMRKPPNEETAFIAGWGLVDEIHHVHTDYLHYIKQHIWTYEQCQKMITNLPKGTLCAGDVENDKYASEGDSGSALIINKYIQIGIVSYKRPDVSLAIVVYTDVSYFYKWIKTNSRNMYCEYHKR